MKQGCVAVTPVVRQSTRCVAGDVAATRAAAMPIPNKKPAEAGFCRDWCRK